MLQLSPAAAEATVEVNGKVDANITAQAATANFRSAGI
jgi:hypothetical protein